LQAGAKSSGLLFVSSGQISRNPGVLAALNNADEWPVGGKFLLSPIDKISLFFPLRLLLSRGVFRSIHSDSRPAKLVLVATVF